MTPLKLTIAYDGSGLVGWQRQPMGTSVQALLEDALAILDNGPVVVTGAGRTDAGVHALGQVASVTLRRSIEPDVVVRAVNMRLPAAVRILSAESTAPEFHARFHAVSKTYRYRIWNGRVLDPFERQYVWFVPAALDVDAMNDAAARLVGRHDFAAFQGSGSDAETTVRTMRAATVTAVEREAGARLVTFDVTGDGFLRHMVRTLAGCLVDIGRGRRDPGWIADVTASRSRAAAGRTAPASGLFLVRVAYE